MKPQSLHARLLTDFLDLEAATGVGGARWEPFQLAFLNHRGRFAHTVKARQIAWSWTAAADALADALLVADSVHVFVSINLEEAKEKIRYARNIHAALRPDLRGAYPLARASQTELELVNGSRLISFPCRPPRGKPRMRIYLDEMAHYPDALAREIYRAALPATVKGDGFVRIGSSPLGARGLFWEIATESTRKYPGYDGRRALLPWWEVHALCRDVVGARGSAPDLPTPVRTARFGTAALVEIFENMFLEDFQQEFECQWVDAATAWIPWEIIQRNQDDALVCSVARGVDAAVDALAAVQRAIQAGTVEGVLVGGIDVGRVRDCTELVLLGKTTTGSLPVRLLVTLERTPFDAQAQVLGRIVGGLPCSKVLIDQNGLGMQLAEQLARQFPGRVEGAQFTNPHKELWAVEARVQAERGATPLPLDRDLVYQIHSIRRGRSATNTATFDAERNAQHHADKFWAWALAIWAARGPGVAALPRLDSLRKQEVWG